MPYRWTLTNLSDLTTEVLSKDPIGWDDGTYSIKRSEIYKGAFHEYTTSLKFHCSGGGKEFIDNIYQTEDIDGRIDVLLEYDCDGSGTYDELFNGIINLASYQTDGNYTTVNIEKSDLLTKLFSRDEISVDLESTTSIGGEAITAVSTTQLPMHSTDIEYVSEWVVEDGYFQSATETYNSIASGWNAFFSPLGNTTSNDFDVTTPLLESDTLGDVKDVASIQDSFLSNILQLNTSGITTPIVMNYEIDFSGTFTDNQTIGGALRGALSYKLNLYYGRRYKGVLMNVITLYNGGAYSADPFTDNFNIQGSGSFTLNAGDEVYLLWLIVYETLSGTVTIADSFNYNRSYFRLSSITNYKSTEAKSVLVHEAFNQVVDSIADSDGNFHSDFYGRTDSEKQTYASDGCGALSAITNGLNIREFNRPILASFKSLFDAYDCVHNIGMGVVNSKIRVEPLSYWYDGATKIISLPNVAEYTVMNDNKRYINKIKVGYSKWESEFHGGINDPNSDREYSTGVSSVKNIYTKLCNYITSTFTIEFTRRKNIEILSTEDWRYDNDNFIISLMRDAYAIVIPERYNNSFVSGANFDSMSTAYNIRLTPLRMLLSHLNIITAGLQKIQGLIKYVTGSGNTLFQCASSSTSCQEDFSGQVLSERVDLNFDESLAANIAPIWGTEIYKFEYPLSYTEFKAINANPYGYVEFYKFENDIKYGFILSMEYKMKTGLTKFELLKKA